MHLQVQSLTQKLKARDSEVAKLTESLQFHTDGNRELKEHLDAALNEDTIKKIEQRISKYKKERDSTREAMKTLKTACDEQLSQKESVILSLQEELLKFQEERKVLAQKYKRRKSELAELKQQSSEKITQLHTQLQEKDELLLSLTEGQEEREEGDEEEEEDDVAFTIGIQKTLHDVYREYASDDDEGEEVEKEELEEDDGELYTTAISDLTSTSRSIKTEVETERSTKTYKTSPSLARSKPQKPTKEKVVCHSHLRAAAKGGSSSQQQVNVNTKSGEKQIIIEPAQLLEEAQIGSVVVVKRKEGMYERGLLRYIGSELCGVELEVESE